MVDSIDPTATDGGAAGGSSDSTLRYTTAVGDRPVSVAVVDLVASLRKEDPIELEPLYETVDPDALETLLESLSGGWGTVSFTYLGHVVTIDADGIVTVAPTDE